MAYKVIQSFSDLQDNGYVYNAGDSYPRYGYKPTEKRIQELLTVNNKAGQVFIKEVENKKKQESKEKKVAAKKKSGE
ncbi:hypothetical protein [Neobacillus sedimentimangrovi]|uniref:hypothetical protein n=1 Tax=Neobacillus sedimentimangrovi TaxID=2699460 RepID=UPI0013D74907|nr:hypothetical protein [Neobacillus sedimentimangrovi]